MAQHSTRSDPHRDPPRKSGGRLFSGIMIGLVIGLVMAAALAWYLGTHRAFRPVDQHVAETIKPDAPPRDTETASPAKPAVRPLPSAQAKMDYTFYGILPGEKPARPVEPVAQPDVTWWLQVAAMKVPAEADRLKARLALLGLQVVTQKVRIEDQTLYRVRIGPYKRQDDAVADVDTLAQNKFDHRLIKEPANQ